MVFPLLLLVLLLFFLFWVLQRCIFVVTFLVDSKCNAKRFCTMHWPSWGERSDRLMSLNFQLQSLVDEWVWADVLFCCCCCITKRNSRGRLMQFGQIIGNPIFFAFKGAISNRKKPTLQNEGYIITGWPLYDLSLSLSPPYCLIPHTCHTPHSSHRWSHLLGMPTPGQGRVPLSPPVSLSQLLLCLQHGNRSWVW